MSELHGPFADLYRETAGYELITGAPISGHVVYESEFPGVVEDERVETVVHATVEPPAVTHVTYHDTSMVAASVSRATLHGGVVTVEHGKVYRADNALDPLADADARYQQATAAANLATVPEAGALLYLSAMADNTPAFYPADQA
jgi:hypothetical protein